VAAAAAAVAAVVEVVATPVAAVVVVGEVVAIPVAPGAVDTPVSAAALWVDAADVEASSLDAASAAAVEAAEAVAAPAGFGPRLGAGSIAAGLILHLRLRYRPSRRSNPLRQWHLSGKVTGSAPREELNNVRHRGPGQALPTSSGNFATLAAIRRTSSRVSSRQEGPILGAGEKRHKQNRVAGLILYDHHESGIVVAALFSKLTDRVFSIRKCRRQIRQVRPVRIVLDVSVPRTYREEISLHRTPHQHTHIIILAPVAAGAVTAT
jgi:hypothetical protein